MSEPRPDIAVFQFERQAQLHCAGDANTERWYGQTKNGAFACLRDAERAGYRANTLHQ